MRIGVQTWGSEGDIQPFIALSSGLARAGHEVTLVVTSVENKDYTSYGEVYGFTVKHVGGFDYDKEKKERIAKKILLTRDPVKHLDIILKYYFEPAVEKMYAASKQLCDENDIVVGHFMLHTLRTAAEKVNRPYALVVLVHGVIPSKYRTPAGLPRLGKWVNPIYWKIVQAFLNRSFLPSVNKLRKREGLLLRKTILHEESETGVLNLVAVSPSLLTTPPDWEGIYHISGFFAASHGSEDEWEMPDDLNRFIESDRPPVYITFGSSATFDPNLQRTAGILVESARLAGCRAIVQTDWDRVSGIPEHRDIYRVTSTPYKYVFPRCAAVVHHGGAGTTQSAILAGCPSIVVEHYADQMFWGLELERLRIAAKRLNKRSLTPQKLARSIRTVLSTPEMKDRAMRLGEQMRKERGVLRAVELIERFIEESAKLHSKSID